MTSTNAITAAAPAPRAISWRRFGVTDDHQAPSVPSTNTCSLVTVGSQPRARRRSLATTHHDRV